MSHPSTHARAGPLLAAVGVSHVDHASSLEPGEGLNAADRAGTEFGGAPLADKRLSARLAKSAGILAAHPGQKINASRASRAGEIAGFCRLVEAPMSKSGQDMSAMAPAIRNGLPGCTCPSPNAPRRRQGRGCSARRKPIGRDMRHQAILGGSCLAGVRPASGNVRSAL
ncbi:MAG: hypothetical protein F4145_08345 [Boseongicola sp. SB0675_bin_26]|nr:hypothetical protein [Boseongicola sp. SB0675_bin_26]